MIKITENELARRVNSLREKLVLETSREEYDKFKADDAKSANIAKVRQLADTPLNQIPRLGDAIDPKTGMIYYGDAGNDSGTISPQRMPFKWTQPGGPGETVKLANLITSAGLTITNNNGYAAVDPVELATIDAPAAPAPEAPAAETPGDVTTPVPAVPPAEITPLDAAPTNSPTEPAVAPAVAADSGTKVSGETPAVTPAVAPYVVKQGDNLTRIARSMGITLQDLLKANPQFQANGRNINLIYPGEKVNPPGTPAPTTPPAAPATPPVPPKLTPKEYAKPAGNYYKVDKPTTQESVSFADDQTLARIVSLSRR